MDYTQYDAPDATALLADMQAGRQSAVDVVRQHLDRLDQVNPALNAAVAVLRDDALEQARAPRPGPLSGLPVTVKETYALAGHAVTIGSQRMTPIRCDADAALVARLRAAGAIVIARSNVPEFVMTGETHNLVYGRTHHPADQSRTPGGSSGGEGALVAAGASPMGFGTDILGSIRIPAAFCGLVGFRPHAGAIDKTGAYPVSGAFFETFNGVGPLTRSVRDARLAYDVIADQPSGAPAAPTGLRLLVPERFPFRAKASCINAAYTAGLDGLQHAGMVRTPIRIGDWLQRFMDIPRLVTGEMDPIWRDWLSQSGAPFSVRRELLRQVLGRPTVQPGFMAWLTVVAAAWKPRSPEALDAVIDRLKASRMSLHAALGDDGIICLPTLGMLAPRHGRMNRATVWQPTLNRQVTAHTLANAMDLSAIAVPAPAHADPRTGLMPSIMLASAPGTEGRLLDAAAALESVLRTPAG